MVRNGADIYIVPVNDVEYIEAFDDYVKIFTGELDGMQVVSERLLPP